MVNAWGARLLHLLRCVSLSGVLAKLDDCASILSLTETVCQTASSGPETLTSLITAFTFQGIADPASYLTSAPEAIFES